MRIGIDIKCLRYNNAGIGRYLRSILEALQKIDDQNEYVLFAPAKTPFVPTAKNFRVQVCKSEIRLPGILWQQSTLPGFIRENDIDIFWGPEQTLPVGNTGKALRVLTVHDLVYKRFPETMVKSVLWINRLFGNKSIEIADAICPVSEFTKSELFHFFPKIGPAKLHIVYNGANSLSTQSIAEQRGTNLLFVGSLEPRKNLSTLIRALEILHNNGQDIPLTITGPKGWRNKSIHNILSKTPIANNITHLGYVNDNELCELYRSCAAVIFPSLYEGFGLPVLEALAQKTPVLTTKDSAMEEIAGDFAVYFDAKDPESIASTIKSFYNNRTAVEQKLKEDAGLNKLLEHYSWENSARTLLELFESLTTRRNT